MDCPIDKAKLPKHLAIIMDGNGRWALSRGLPRSAGHHKGVAQLKPLLQACGDWGIGHLTIFAFSTENWGRPAAEVSVLLSLIEEFFFREVEELNRNGVRIRVFGDLDGLPERPRAFLQRAVALTASNTGVQLNLALNYGGRAELARAARLLAEDAAAGRLKPSDITEEVFQTKLYSYGQPDVDLVIRTAGEFRLSNFLLYQVAYAEFVTLPMYWPDFDQAALAEALRAYAGRERRFGRI